MKSLANIALLCLLTLALPAQAESTALQNLLQIDVPFVSLHSGPGQGYPVVHVIEKSEQVQVLVKRTSWIKVEDKRGNQGWFNQNARVQVNASGEVIGLDNTEQYDYQQRTWEGSVMVGDFNGANFYSIGLGYFFSPVINTELTFAKSQGDISNSDLFELTVLSQPFPEFIVSPYFSVGAGIIYTTPHSVLADAQSRENTLVSASVGAKYHLARNFVLRAEHKYSLVLTDRDESEEVKLWKVGFSVFF